MHKAFACITNIVGAQDGPSGPVRARVQSKFVVIDSDGVKVPGSTDSDLFIDFTDSAQNIHEKIADDIRSNYAQGENPITDIVVIFPDAPGRY